MVRALSVSFATFAVAIAFILALPRPALSEPLFTTSIPEWVIPLSVPGADPAMQAAVTDGVLTLLTDEQIRWDGEERQIFVRIARLITDPSGVASAGRVDMIFSPDSETVLLGRVRVTRDGQTEDLTETVFAQTLDAAGSLARGIPEGLLAAEVIVPNLQSGDVVEVAYLRRQLPVIAGVNRAGTVRLEQDVPVVLARAVVNWPDTWPIYISGWPSRVTFAQEAAPGIVRQTWTRQAHVPTLPGPLLPPGYSENTVIAFSTFPDWSGVTGALSGHYMGSYPLGAAWDTKLRAIQAEFSYPGDRAIAALRAVQDDLPTQARPLSADGWLARLPADVTNAGGGDAKDKALLLRAMLDKMGIEAYVALTNRAQGHDLNSVKPAFEAFDHAIVKVMIDELPYWMDPSTTNEGGDLFGAAVPDFGYALPLAGADQAQLELIDVGYASSWTTYIDETYNFTLLGVFLTVVTTYYGPAANAYRQDLYNPDSRQADAEYLQVYEERYPDLRMLEAVEVVDDKVGNQLTLTERYLIPATTLNAMPSLFVQTNNPLGFLPEAGLTGRTAALYLGKPFTSSHRVNLFNLPIEMQPPLGASAYGDAISFSFSGYATAARNLTLEWSYGQYQQTVPPNAVDQLIRDAALIANSTSFEINLRP